jgi:signal transduction histidine kinase
LSDTTLGLQGVDEGFLQRIMDRHPNGAVWYFDSVSSTVKNDTVEAQDLPEETSMLLLAFPSIRQLAFLPLTDPTSQKRLAGCFIWKHHALPVFSDVVDLPALKGFIHVVESEISRFDAAAAVKQQESFVSSVSHELSESVNRIL